MLFRSGRYVDFDLVVRLAREGIESGAFRPFPAQLHFNLDMAMRDVDRVLAAATKTELEEQTKPISDDLKHVKNFEQISKKKKGLGKRNKITELYKDSPDIDKILAVENRFHDIIANLMSEQGLKVNDSSEVTEQNKDCI